MCLHITYLGNLAMKQTSHLNPHYIFVSWRQKLFSICGGLFPIFARVAKQPR